MESQDTNQNKELREKEVVENKITLGQFVENQQKLISVLGIFTAITTFTYNLPLKPFGYFLSSIFLLISILIWFELWARFPRRPESKSLSLFENLMHLVLCGLFGYWLLAYRMLWYKISYFVIWIFTITILSNLLTKYNLPRKIMGKKLSEKKTAKIIFGIIFFAICFVIAYYIAKFIAPFTNAMVDMFFRDLNNYKFEL
jgi:hypothetical protein